MTMELSARIRRLERERIVTRVVLLVVISVLCVNLGLDYVIPNTRTVVAGGFVLEDEGGRTRARLETNADGRPLFMLTSEDGAPGVILGYDRKDGQAGLSVGMFGPRTYIGFDVNGSPTVRLQDGEGQPKVVLGVTESGQGDLTVDSRVTG